MKRILSFMMMLVLVVTTLAVPVMVSAADDVIIVAGENFFASTGNWSGESSLKGPTGKPAYWSSDTKEATVTYSAEALVPGEYEVFFWKNVHTAKNDNAVPLEISHSGGISNAVVDCSTGESGWESVGKFTFTESEAEYVKVIRSGKSADVITRTGGVMFRPLKLSASTAAVVDMDEGDKYIYDLFNYLGITTVFDFTDNAKQVTRAEFLAAVMKALDAPSAVDTEPFLDVPENHAFYNEIMSAKSNGIVAGNGLGYFNPDNPIMLEEAAKIAVHSLELLSTIENIGVERANAQGGYKIGYILELNKQGLAKGLPSNAADAPLTVESVKVIIKNILDADIREMITEDRIPVLERVHDIYEGSGKVNAVFGASVKNGTTIDKGFAIIDSTRYELGNLSIDKYLGMETDFYYVDKDGADQIIAMIGQPGAKYLEIDADDILNTTLNVGTGNVEIEYYNEKSKVERETVHFDTDVYYNNVLISNYTAADFKPLDGSLVLVSNNGGSHYDYAYINCYKNFVVKNVNVTDEKIYEIYNNDCVNLKAYADGYEIIKDGRTLELSKVYEWDVLSVPVQRAGTSIGNVAKIQLSRKKVAGIIEAKNKKSLFIDGVEYELSDEFMNLVSTDAKEASKIELERAVTLYLDAKGKIAATYEGIDGAAAGSKGNYAYIRQTAAARGGLSGKVEIEAFASATGTWENLKLEDEISYTAGGVTTKIKAEDIVKQRTFIDDVPLPEGTTAAEYTFNPKSANADFVESTKVEPGTWITNSGLKGPSGVPAPYAQGDGNADFTYYLDNQYIAANKTYVVSIYILPNAINNDNMLVTVYDKNGSTEYRVDTLNEPKGWYELGKHTFSGAAEEKVVITHDEPNQAAKKTSRASDIKLVEDLDYDAVKQPVKENMFASGGAPVDKVIEYKTNSKGFVKEIEVLDLTSHNPTVTNINQGTRYKNVAGNVFVTNNLPDFMIDSSTVIFAFPNDASDKDNYAVIPITELKHDMYYSGVDAYDENDDRYSPVIIIREYYNEFTSFSNQESYEVMAVSSKSQVLDENGENCVALKGFVGSEEKTVLAVEDNLFDGIGIGDFVILKPNKDDKIYHKVMLYDYEEGSDATSASRYGKTNAMTWRFSAFYGKVIDTANGGTTLFVSQSASDDAKENTVICNLSSPTVLICNEKEQTLTLGSVNDISIYDNVAVRFDNFRGRMVVIYRED